MSRRTKPAAVALAALTLLTAACAGSGGDTASTSSTTRRSSTSAPPTTAAPTTTSTTEAPARPDLAAVQVGFTRVASLTQPLAVTRCAGRDTVLVAEQPGRIRELRGGEPLPNPFLDLRPDISAGGERGLLGIACSPDGRRFYASYTNRSGDSRLDEFAVPADGAPADIGTRRNVMAIDQPAPNHNGGNIVFGPDGLLWYGLGDGGGRGDTFNNAQNTSTVLGAILRIDPRPSGGAPYSSPADNPFAGGGGRPEIAVYGVRNPWRWSFDRATGDLWIGDVGQDAIEEIDHLAAGHILGANLGWPAFEGTSPYRRGSPAPGAIPPVFEYRHADGQSVVGGYVYRGSAIPALRGAYLFADTYKAQLRAIVVDGATTVDQRVLGAVPGGLVSSFAEDPSGEVYVLSLAGGVYRIDRR